MGDSRRNPETDSSRKRKIGRGNPYTETKKRMLSKRDVPGILEIEGSEILAIPARVENELRPVLLQCGQGTHERSDGGDNVQILERVLCV